VTRPVIFGVLNVTPDSFSDGGRWADASDAITHATELWEQGADVIDIGGESTRPGADRVPLAEEQGRVLPVVRELVAQGMRVSVDTMNATTAALSVEAGAEFINDVSGGLADAGMYRAMAGSPASYIVMHWRGHSATMQNNPHYVDVVQEVRREIAERVAEAIVWGVDPAKIIVDPGLGFSKTGQHNWQLLAGLPELGRLGLPILVGASRKGFLAEFAPDGAPASERDAATATISGLAAQAAAWGVRVHNVPTTRQVLDVWNRWSDAGTPTTGSATTSPTTRTTSPTSSTSGTSSTPASTTTPDHGAPA
jgi:dihydropteroate synthase